MRSKSCYLIGAWYISVKQVAEEAHSGNELSDIDDADELYETSSSDDYSSCDLSETKNCDIPSATQSSCTEISFNTECESEIGEGHTSINNQIPSVPETSTSIIPSESSPPTCVTVKKDGVQSSCATNERPQIQAVSAVSWERREIDRVYIHSSSDKKPTIKRKNQ